MRYEVMIRTLTDGVWQTVSDVELTSTRNLTAVVSRATGNQDDPDADAIEVIVKASRLDPVAQAQVDAEPSGVIRVKSGTLPTRAPRDTGVSGGGLPLGNRDTPPPVDEVVTPPDRSEEVVDEPVQ